MNIILSIHPKWAKLIYEGKKTIEWRKNVPTKADGYSVIFLYETAPVCKVTGRVAYNGCDAVSVKRKRIDFGGINYISDKENEDAFNLSVNYGCVKEKDLEKYQGKSDYVYAWYIQDQEKFSTPKSLEEFNIKRAPQSWCYTEVDG